MRYMLLICGDEAIDAAMSGEEIETMIAEYHAFSADLQASGAYVASDRLHPVATATTVRVRDGELLTTDGPFAETKEQLGGFYLIDVADLDEAIGWARRVPSARHGSVEVRPIWDMSEDQTG